jgi:hypothetical protein
MAIVQRFATENYVSINMIQVPDWALEPTKPVYTAAETGADPEGSALDSLVEAKSYADTAVAALVNSAPETLDTLGELAAAFEENADMVETLNLAITDKAEKSDLESTQELVDINAESIENLQTQVNGLLELVYPVGAIYLSATETNPSVLFGFGVWEQIEDTFLLASGSKYIAGSTGGAATVTLTNAQMPNVIGDITMHSGGTATNISNTSGCFSAQITNQSKYRDGGTVGTTANSIGIVHFDNGGRGQAHNNMPPYLAVYVWKRVS